MVGKKCQLWSGEHSILHPSVSVRIVANLYHSFSPVVPSNEGCTGLKREIVVTVDKPFVTPVWLNGPSTVCSNEDAKYYVLPVPGVTYTWHLPESAIVSKEQKVWSQ